ncbi:hypothetical protein BDR04DRAFT_498416 [Suillus decipiens]|nr:hypothetical protein BDR04DRAFT_498416 [Suillus decipiens]
MYRLHCILLEHCTPMWRSRYPEVRDSSEQVREPIQDPETPKIRTRSYRRQGATCQLLYLIRSPEGLYTTFHGLCNMFLLLVSGVQPAFLRVIFSFSQVPSDMHRNGLLVDAIRSVLESCRLPSFFSPPNAFRIRKLSRLP